jgi:serine/threonine protein kinase
MPSHLHSPVSCTCRGPLASLYLPAPVLPLAGDLVGLLDVLGRPLSLLEARVVAVHLLRALDHAHAHGIFHLDVKPDNTFVGDVGYVLGDWGSACVVEQSEDVDVGAGAGSVPADTASASGSPGLPVPGSGSAALASAARLAPVAMAMASAALATTAWYRAPEASRAGGACALGPCDVYALGRLLTAVLVRGMPSGDPVWAGAQAAGPCIAAADFLARMLDARPEARWTPAQLLAHDFVSSAGGGTA